MKPAFALIAFLAAPAYANGDDPAALGRAIFDENCQACHAADGSGENADGVDIRGLSLARVKRAVKGFDDMPEFDLSAAEIAAITAWLKVLDAGD